MFRVQDTSLDVDWAKHGRRPPVKISKPFRRGGKCCTKFDNIQHLHSSPVDNLYSYSPICTTLPRIAPVVCPGILSTIGIVPL